MRKYNLAIKEESLFHCLRENINWLFLTFEKCKCWLHQFWKGYQKTFEHKWVSRSDNKMFQERAFNKYVELEFFYYQYIDPTIDNY